MSSRSDYFALVRQRPQEFVNPQGAAFEILLEEGEIQRAEEQAGQRLVAAGLPPEWASVGVAFRDQYVTILRDAVRYVDGTLGTYIRMWDSHPEFRGVVVLPVWQEKVLLVRHFRHATRAWHLEIPRGFGSSEDAASGARRELEEEVGATVSRLVELGDVYPDAGAMGGRVALFLGEVESYGDGEAKEGITEILPTPVSEFERMIAAGELTDGFLLAAYARAKTRGLL